jgi:hypothetical protein
MSVVVWLLARDIYLALVDRSGKDRRSGIEDGNIATQYTQR